MATDSTPDKNKAEQDDDIAWNAMFASPEVIEENEKIADEIRKAAADGAFGEMDEKSKQPKE